MFLLELSVFQFTDDVWDVYAKKFDKIAAEGNCWTSWPWWETQCLLLLHLSLISWPKMKTKTCWFSTISDSATHSNSCRLFFGINFRCRKLTFEISNSGRTITTLTTSPPLPGCFGQNGTEDVPIQEYFVFSHALHLLPAVFGILFCCGDLNKFIVHLNWWFTWI